MQNRKSQLKQLKRKRRKSIFCQKSPASCLVVGAIFLKDAPIPMWVPCQGKVYKNGYFRYLHNGKEGTVGPRYYRFYPDGTDEQMLEQIKTLNLTNLKNRNPKKGQSPKRFDYGICYDIPEPILEPVVMPEDTPPDQMIPVIDTTVPATPVVEATPTPVVRENIDETGFVDLILAETPVAPRAVRGHVARMPLIPYERRRDG